MATYTIVCPGEGAALERFDIEADDDREAIALFCLRRERPGCQLWRDGLQIPTIFSELEEKRRA
jgi:hypothetical protein